MPFLVLDLDETTFVMDDNRKTSPLIHEAHTIYGCVNAELESVKGTVHVTVGILNPKLLLKTLEAASHSDGLIVLTSGNWTANVLSSILFALEDEYNVSSDVKKMVANALFYSPVTECHRGLSNGVCTFVETIRFMPKNERLKKIIQFDSLHKAKFIVLDDNKVHIDSFKGMDNVTAIRATTNIDDKSFYQQAIDALTITPTLRKTERRVVGDKFSRTIDILPEVKKRCLSTEYSYQLFGQNITMAPLPLHVEFKRERKEQRHAQTSSESHSFTSMSNDKVSYFDEAQQNKHSVTLSNQKFVFNDGLALNGEYIFCVLAEKSARLICAKDGHHSDLANGKKVLAAGSMVFNRGKICMITNNSGHYKPTDQQMLPVIRVLSYLCSSLKHYTSYCSYLPIAYDVNRLLNSGFNDAKVAVPQYIITGINTKKSGSRYDSFMTLFSKNDSSDQESGTELTELDRMKLMEGNRHVCLPKIHDKTESRQAHL